MVPSALLLAVITWVAHFWFFRSLGLYEDDWGFVGSPVTWDLADWIKSTRGLVEWSHGRPIGYVGSQTLAFWSLQFGGLPMVYVSAYLLLMFNVWLFYLTMRRTISTHTALLAAVMFALYPPDASRTLLTHGLELQLGMAFLVIAAYSYVRGWLPGAYALIIGALLTYESTFLPFVAVPALRFTWSRRWLRHAGWHVLICGLIFVAVASVRVFLQPDDRSIGTGAMLKDHMMHSMIALLGGPLISLLLFARRPLGGLIDMSFPMLAVAIAAVVPIWWIVHRYILVEQDGVVRSHFSWQNAFIRLRAVMNGDVREYLYLISGGLALNSISYGLSFTHFPPTASTGRMTSVHVAGAFGGAMLAAGLLLMVVAGLRRRAPRWVGSLLISGYLASLIVAGLRIQQDFRQSWQLQKEFWKEVVPLCPDAGDQTLIVIPRSSVTETRYIITHAWNTSIAIQLMYRIPDKWQRPPRVFVVDDDWRQKRVIRADGQYLWLMPDGWWSAQRVAISEGNLIYMERQKDKLVRKSGILTIQDGAVHLKEPGQPALARLPRTSLGELVLAE